MTIEKILLGLIVAVAAAECSSLLEQLARGLTRWAVRLSYGQTPRAEIRLRERFSDLDGCRGQIAKLLYALRWMSRGILEWLGRADTAGWTNAGPDQVFAAVTALGNSLQDFGGDIRAQAPARRRAFDGQIVRLHTLLAQPSEVFDDQAAAVLVFRTATACHAYVDDRNERAALSLVKAARPLMKRLGRRHPASLSLRRGYAEALLALGHHRQADALLRGLMDDEAQVFGAQTPLTVRTAQLHCWARQDAGQFQEAESGLKALDAPGIDMTDRQHNQCKCAWTLGKQGRLREAAELYDLVIADRSHSRSPDHPDTLDARHSKGKMFVHHADGPAAYPVLQSLLPDVVRVLGARHPNTLETRKYLALARALADPHSARERRRARRELRRILRLQIRRHGPDYPHCRDTRQWLGTLCGPAERP